MDIATVTAGVTGALVPALPFLGFGDQWNRKPG